MPNSEGSKNFLFVSWIALNGDLAWKVKKEGHNVKYYIDEKDESDVYDGLLEKVEKWQEHIDWADIVIFDDTGFGEIAEKLRKKGKLVVGGTIYTDRTEEDREFGQGEMKKFGMNILPNYNFSNFDEALEFLRKNPGRYVFKPNGKAADEKNLLFIGEEDDGKDMIEILEDNKDFLAEKIDSFQLQKFVAGVEIATGAFFNGKKFVHPININFEHKRLFPGDQGPFTGDMGALMYWTAPNAIYNSTLLKMESVLAEHGYVGYYDINCIVNGRGIYPLEFTARFGYPTISTQVEGITEPMGELLFKLARGEDFEIKTKRGFQIGVVLAVPPYPFYSEEIFSVYKGSSILFKNNGSSLEGINWGDVKMVDGVLKLAGESGYALIVTGSGITVEEARKQAYHRIKNVRLHDMFYRVDVGTRWFQDSDKLQSWGYIQ
ncbi:MAG: phosphoribosylamine--glycine ligase [Parcubacteria group bacterium]|jgi:phosphoribosylamine--glycine ligase